MLTRGTRLPSSFVRAICMSAAMGAAASASSGAPAAAAAAAGSADLSEAALRARLSPHAYRVMREQGTERAWTSELNKVKGPGDFQCAACGQLLFTGDDKFDSGSGWPSFVQPAAPGSVAEHRDVSAGMVRTEVTCSRCASHLGHVFDDGPRDKTGLRYCINGVALDFIPKK